MRYLLAFVMTLLVTGARAGDDPDMNLPSLKGINSVMVVVSLAKEIERAGLSAETIKTDAELKLRLAGISITMPSDSPRSPGAPWLLLFIEAARTPSPELYGVYIHVGLNQDVLLQRDPSLKRTGRFSGTPFSVDTWSTAEVGVFGRDRVNEIRDTFKDLVDKFVNAYLTINPRK
jgi:hypothetical protein